MKKIKNNPLFSIMVYMTMTTTATMIYGSCAQPGGSRLLWGYDILIEGRQ